MIAAGRLHPARDQIPDEFSEKVLFVAESNPNLLTYINLARDSILTASGSTTIYTTPTDKDFYLTSVSISVSKNATCDDASGNIVTINATVDAVIQSIVYIIGQSVTALQDSVSIAFPKGIKLDRGTAITLGGGTFTLGAKIRSGNITGIIIERE